MHYVMRVGWNKHAEKAGYGELGMNPLKFIYWWERRLCRKIRYVKSQRPTATREEIAYHMLDRWGLLVLPWYPDIVRASLCKLQDHGIAIRVGAASTDIEGVHTGHACALLR